MAPRAGQGGGGGREGLQGVHGRGQGLQLRTQPGLVSVEPGHETLKLEIKTRD